MHMNTCVDRKSKPELMSPAGHWPQLEAAIAAGADAVYFGLQHFSARAKVGFTLEELPRALSQLHRHAVKGFVTFNTLVFDHELKQACQTIEAIAESGADAIIVQDVGIAKLAQQIAPDLEVHGSTQMSITSAEGAELAASLGCTRVVLGRELSLADMRRIAKATDVELEVFVHGALCVSYSGQCFSSEAWGGRSANRGQCAQACRLPYDLIVDGQKKELDEFRYLLSPGDLYALEQIPELIDIGIACFKIEGRYKGKDYVSLTTRAYRQAIDRAFGESTDSESVSRNELEQIYSRGLGSHFVSGTNHQNVVVGRAPRHRGLKVGVVAKVERSSVVIETEHPIHPGDGLVFDSAKWRSPNEAEEGGNVYEVDVQNEDLATLRFGHSEVDFTRIRNGDLVWRTNDPKLAKKTKRLGSESLKKTAIDFRVVGAIGKSLEVFASTDRNESANFRSDELLSEARNRSLNLETLKEQLGRMGGTPFNLGHVEFASTEPVFCPVSMLNQARRAIVEQLIVQREKPVARKINPYDLSTTEKQESVAASSIELHLLVRNAQQLEAAIATKPNSITLDYLELYGLRPSVQQIQDAGIVARVASPRILKPSEQKVIRFLLSLECQILVRSGGLLHDLVQNFGDENELPDLHGDFSLNAANAVSFRSYKDMGVARMTPTFDLNAEQIADLVKHTSPDQLEVVVFHHLPVFHTEHCVFCRFLSEGTDSTNCGHPCEKHQIALQDNSGRQHTVLADVGCRNTVFGAQAQCNAKHIQSWRDVGILHYRLEFVHQSQHQVEQIALAFKSFFGGQMPADQLERELGQNTDQGLTEGSLYVPGDFKQLVQLS